jgi:hypothetical protein
MMLMVVVMVMMVMVVMVMDGWMDACHVADAWPGALSAARFGGSLRFGGVFLYLYFLLFPFEIHKWPQKVRGKIMSSAPEFPFHFPAFFWFFFITLINKRKTFSFYYYFILFPVSSLIRRKH